MTDTLSGILAELDNKRTRSAARRQAAIEEAYRQFPALERIKREEDETLLAQMGELLKHPGDREAIRARTDARMQQLCAERDALIAAHGLAGAFALHADCPLCGDTGYVYAQNRKQLCDCVLEQVYLRMYGAEDISALPGSFERFDERIFSGEAQRARMRAARRFMQDYASRFPAVPKRMLVLMGSAGLGKSFLLACLAREAAKKTRRVVYISAFALFRTFHRHRLGELALLDPLFEADLLLVDDLGTEPMTANVTREYLFQLVDSRLLRGLPTAFATNLTEYQLKERYTELVYSRLFAVETGARLVFAGADLRLRAE